VRGLVVLGVLLLVPAGLAAGTVQIEDVGLRGYYAQAPHPTRIRLQVTNTRAQPQTLTLHLKIVARVNERLDRTDTFSQEISCDAGETRFVDVPVLISWWAIGYSIAEDLFLVVDLRDAAGQLVGRARRKLDYPVYDAVVAIVCDQEKLCQDVQSRITFSGTPEEQAQKGREMRFVAVREPPAMWWAYSAAHTVVLARRADGLTPAERDALEEYLRLGSRLVLLEEGGASGFLAAYGTGLATGVPQWVGRGKLVRLAGLRDPHFGGLFSGPALERMLSPSSRIYYRFGSTELGYLRHRLTTSFSFPSLGWLLGWLGVYTLLVGVANFTLLNRLGRREWGWITVPAVAVAFAAALYAASAAQRPREFHADEVAIYWMDERSGLAAMEIGVRVAAPHRATVTLSLPGAAIFSGEPRPSVFSTFMNLVSAPEPELGRTVRLGPPRRFELSLLQWSFQDFEFRHTRRFPGTVRRVDGRLHNDTGQAFRDALYVNKEKVYFLGALAPGAAVDLTAARQEPLDRHAGRVLFFMQYPSGLSEEEDPTERASRRTQKPADTRREWEEWRRLPGQPFAPVELIRGWPADGGRVFEQRTGVFFGLAEESVAGAELAEVRHQRRSFALTIVSYGPEK